MRQPASLLQGLEQAGILAVLRAPSAEHAVRAVDALVARAGSELCSPDAMATGRWDEIEATAHEFAAAYQSASSDRP